MRLIRGEQAENKGQAHSGKDFSRDRFTQGLKMNNTSRADESTKRSKLWERAVSNFKDADFQAP